MTTMTKPVSQSGVGIGAPNRVAFSEVNQPGAYLCHWSGHLIRVPEDALKPGRSPVLDIVSNDELYVTKLADNPFIPITKARMIACDLDLPVNF